MEMFGKVETLAAISRAGVPRIELVKNTGSGASKSLNPNKVYVNSQQVFINDGTSGGTTIANQTVLANQNGKVMWQTNLHTGETLRRAINPVGDVVYSYSSYSSVANPALLQIGRTTGQNLVARVAPQYPIATYQVPVTSLSTTNYYNVLPLVNYTISFSEGANVTSKYNDFYDYEYNAYTNPGPLAKDKHNLNFYGGRYNERVLTEDKIYYRAGSVSNKYGRYFVETPPKSVIQVRMDTAVKPYWIDTRTSEWTKNLRTGEQTAKSMIEQVYVVRVPAGTVIYEGPIAPQGGMYLGGMETKQIFVPDTRLPGIEFFKYSK